ncbi:MAG: hypothetical protein ABI832_20370 [bacterium]
MTNAEAEAMKRRIEELEKIIVEYVERYGLTEPARKAMVRRAPKVAE